MEIGTRKIRVEYRRTWAWESLDIGRVPKVKKNEVKFRPFLS